MTHNAHFTSTFAYWSQFEAFKFFPSFFFLFFFPPGRHARCRCSPCIPQCAGANLGLPQEVTWYLAKCVVPSRCHWDSNPTTASSIDPRADSRGRYYSRLVASSGPKAQLGYSAGVQICPNYRIETSASPAPLPHCHMRVRYWFMVGHVQSATE